MHVRSFAVATLSLGLFVNWSLFTSSAPASAAGAAAGDAALYAAIVKLTEADAELKKAKSTAQTTEAKGDVKAALVALGPAHCESRPADSTCVPASAADIKVLEEKVKAAEQKANGIKATAADKKAYADALAVLAKAKCESSTQGSGGGACVPSSAATIKDLQEKLKDAEQKANGIKATAADKKAYADALAALKAAECAS